MENHLTFFDVPIDQEPYVSKSRECEIPPIRILITEAGTKAAQHLIYKICSGQVFGPDQGVILHLVSAKGILHPKAIQFDLEECGFPIFKDLVVSAQSEKSYRNVDVVILLAMFEELAGYTLCDSFLNQIKKARQVVKNMQKYAKPDSKLVICSPSTKGVLALLTFLGIFEPQMRFKNITGVTLLDETVAKCHIAAQLKTTTDKIKNIVIWGATFPDLRNTTVLMYPPEDKANFKKVEIPVMQVLENHKWIYSDFTQSIYKRILSSELATYGGAVAAATAKHLKLLFQGSDCQEEIVSMGIIIPPGKPFGLTQNIGFSLPVATCRGTATVREDVNYEIATHLMNLRSMYSLHRNTFMQSLFKMVNTLFEYEKREKEESIWQHFNEFKKFPFKHVYFKYIISPGHNEQMSFKEHENITGSVTWDEVNVIYEH